MKKKGIKDPIVKTPIIRDLARFIKWRFFSKSFPGSKLYWEQRYDAGQDSGRGSRKKLAEFKADIVNGFVSDKGVESVIEYGCGDGKQLQLYSFPKYLGFDVSPTAVSLCYEIFRSNNTKTFKLSNDYDGERAPLTLSIDVIYHLVEDDVFDSYMKRLFESSDRYVIIYSTNTDKNVKGQAPHVRHRKFTKWIDEHLDDWKLIQHIQNKYSSRHSFKKFAAADFYIYEKF
jgi:hypothetical protein